VGKKVVGVFIAVFVRRFKFTARVPLVSGINKKNNEDLSDLLRLIYDDAF
jgi:hypothetical protein